MNNFKTIVLATWIVVIAGFGQIVAAEVIPVQVGSQAATKIGIVISSNDPETVWNAFRFANFACQKGDSVSVFLLGKGVEAETIKDKGFDVKGMMQSYVSNGGKIFTCGTCLKSRNAGGTELCPISSMADMYAIVKQSDKLVTF